MGNATDPVEPLLGKGSDAGMRLLAALEQMPLGVSAADVPAGSFIFLNTFGAKMLGTAHAPKDLDDYVNFGAIHPDGTPYAAAEYPLARAASTGEVVDRESMIYLRPDGNRIELLVSAARVFDDAGEPLMAVCTFEDVTERGGVLRELDDTSRRLQAILANTREAVFLMDDRQHCIYANAAAEKLTGYSFAELSAKPLHDVIHSKKPDGSHYPLEECPIDRAFPERAQMSGEELFVARDGSLYPVAFTASPLLDDEGKPIGTVIEVRNIAEEKARDQALQEETRALETLNQVGAALSAELDLERLIQRVTDAGVELTGACFGAYFHNVFDETGERLWLYTLSGAERSDFDQFGHPRATEIFGPTFRNEGVIRSGDILADPRYGKNPPHQGMPAGHLPVRSYLAIPVVSRSGDVLGGLLFGHPEPDRFAERHERLMVALAAQAAVAIDNARLHKAAQDEIAERHRAEERLRELNDTLERRVEEEVARRARAEDALRQAQKMEAVGQLTGGIAHDFNNLLTIVVGNIDMGRRALEASGGEPRVQRALENAQKGAERAASLTQRLLAFSRRQPLAPKPLDVDKLMQGMSDLLNRSLGETVKLEIVTSPGLWRVEADPNQLESALLNLAVNARDAMPQGGTLTIETANARLDDAYAASHAEVAPGQYVVIAVTDTGVGIPKALLEKVFEPFFTTKEVGKGTGLGLSMIYGFVKQSGGHVKIYSELGKGTTFKIYLPRLLSDVSEEQPANLAAGLEGSAEAETILVVEDDDDVRAYTVECLRELGYRVLEAHDGTSALRLLERQGQPVDLLFTDVVMPGMSGRELADAARERQADLRVLYTSGYTRNAIVHGGRLDEGVEMIAKPFTFEALAQKIRDVLDQGRTRRVLVVEDEPTVRMLAIEALGASGYAAEEAATAVEALSKVRAAQGRYDMVIIDSGLPDKNGGDLAAELRSLHADMPLLLTSGEHEADLRERFGADRCATVIGKPFSGGRLIEALRSLGLRCGSRKPQ